MADALREKIRNIFLKVQRDAASCKTLLLELQTIFHEVNYKTFKEEFQKFVGIVCLKNKGSDSMKDKLLKFKVQFCISIYEEFDGTNKNILRDVLQYLLVIANDCEKISQQHICQFMNYVLKICGKKHQALDEDICKGMQNYLLKHLSHSNGKLKMTIIDVLQQLQDPSDDNSVITYALLSLLNDSNYQVRKFVVQCMAFTRISIPPILERCLDINEDVRYATYLKFTKIFKNLKVSQRQFILNSGFEDISEKINTYTKKILIPYWLTLCDNDYIQFLNSLLIDYDEKEFEKSNILLESVCYCILDTVPLNEIIDFFTLNEQKLLSKTNLTWEKVLLWRCLLNVVRKQESETLDQILPELLNLCQFVNTISEMKPNLLSEWNLIQFNHIMLELFKVLFEYDFSDVVCSEVCEKTIVKCLIEGQNLTDNTLKLMEIFEKLHPDNDDRAEKICKIISEIQTAVVHVPLSEDQKRKRDVKLAEFRFQLRVLTEERDVAIENEKFDAAIASKTKIDEIKKQMAEFMKQNGKSEDIVKKTDDLTVCYILDILYAFMQSPEVIKLPEPFRDYPETVLIPILKNPLSDVLWRAQRTLCVFCLCNKELAESSVIVFFEALYVHVSESLSEEQLTLVALQSLTDLILVYGLSIVNSDNNSVTINKTIMRSTYNTSVFSSGECPPLSASLIYELFMALLDDASLQIKETACECVAKLIFNEKINSPNIFIKLLLKWFNPVTEKETRLRQIISRLFTDYFKEGNHCYQVLEETFVPIINIVLNAPKKSSLSNIVIEDVIKYLLSISDPRQHKFLKQSKVQGNISILLCEEFIRQNSKKHQKVYLKVLLNIPLLYSENNIMNKLKILTKNMAKSTNDKQLLKLISQFQIRINQRNLKVQSEKTMSTDSVVSAEQSETTTASESIVSAEQSHINSICQPELQIRLERNIIIEKMCQELANTTLNSSTHGQKCSESVKSAEITSNTVDRKTQSDKKKLKMDTSTESRQTTATEEINKQTTTVASNQLILRLSGTSSTANKSLNKFIDNNNENRTITQKQSSLINKSGIRLFGTSPNISPTQSIANQHLSKKRFVDSKEINNSEKNSPNKKKKTKKQET